MALKKHRVRVSDVDPGTEEKLRHFLESVVLQANASRGPDENDSGDRSDAERADSDDDLRVEMTERFRSFAEEENELMPDKDLLARGRLGERSRGAAGDGSQSTDHPVIHVSDWRVAR